MKKAKKRPEKLYIYECRGPRLPQKEPVYEGFLGVWPEPPFYYFFSNLPALSQILQWLQTQPEWELRQTYELDYHQWQQIAHEDQQIGPFLIQTVPSPHYHHLSEEIPICIRPGLTFGSGVHPSTRGCLLSIAKLYEKFSPENVVDLGTGTGILALACARLGAHKVWALDCNFLAVQEARKNIQINQLENRVHPLVAQTLKIVRTQSDLLLMNLEWPCLQKALREKDWRRFRWVILSGFLESQEDNIKCLIPHNFSTILRVSLENWVTLTLQLPW
jgi:ribosomal protein L11 methyltransferase